MSDKIAKEMENTIIFLAPLIADMLADDEEQREEFTKALLQTKVVEMGEDAYTMRKMEADIIVDALESCDRPSGEWQDLNGDGTAYKCSNCNEVSCCNDNYCPNYGARMKGGAE